MATRNDILTFARNGFPFSLNRLLDYFQSAAIDFNRRSLSTQLSRMVNTNELRRVKRGCFIISEDQKSEFNPCYNEEMKNIAEIVRSSYPFLDICVWNLEDIKRLSHYASNRDVIYVEVDRDAVEGVFGLLTETLSDRRIFLNPSETEYNYYINRSSALVVKPLRTEAPCIKDNKGILHPSIEKIMVDVVSDEDFTPWQGYETVRLYETIFNLYDVSTSKLMRYAHRRAKSERIRQLLSEREGRIGGWDKGGGEGRSGYFCG